MRYVLDASVALKWVLIEPDTAKSRHIRDEFRNGVQQNSSRTDSFAPGNPETLRRTEGLVLGRFLGRPVELCDLL